MTSKDIKAASGLMIKDISQEKIGPEQGFEKWVDPDRQRWVESILTSGKHMG